MSAEVFVLEELSVIKDQLKCQLSALEKKEVELKEREVALETKESAIRKREAVLFDVEKCLDSCCSNINECIQKKVSETAEEHRLLGEKLEASYQRVLKENRRLKESYVTVCSANEKLKNQLETEKVHCSEVKRKLAAARSRLSTFTANQNVVPQSSSSSSQPIAPGEGGKKKTYFLKTDGLLPVRADDDGREEKAEQQLIQNLMQWVHSSLSEQVTTDSQNNSLEVLSVQILPSIALLLPKIPTQQQYIWIQFTCQILLYLNSKKKLLLATSLRRISEVCVASLMNRQSTQTLGGSFCRSCDIHTRVISSLVVLLSSTQVDVIVQVLKCLKQDLRKPHVVEDVFLSSGGVQALLPYLHPSPKYSALCSCSLDIFILISSDSGLRHLLKTEWFSSVAELLRKEHSQSQVLEKLSILLQRLSCLRESRVLFERSETLQLLRSLSTSKDVLTSFLQLNISSILTNLN